MLPLLPTNAFVTDGGQKLDGGWGRAARGISWKTRRRRKATSQPKASKRTADKTPPPAAPDSDIELLSPGRVAAKAKAENDQDDREVSESMMSSTIRGAPMVETEELGQIQYAPEVVKPEEEQQLDRWASMLQSSAAMHDEPPIAAETLDSSAVVQDPLQDPLLDVAA
jgi:hypothetical protein